MEIFIILNIFLSYDKLRILFYMQQNAEEANILEHFL